MNNGNWGGDNVGVGMEKLFLMIVRVCGVENRREVEVGW